MSVENDRETAAVRLRRVEALYHEILGRPAHERRAALAAACNGDHELAAEVQALLDQPESAAGPLAGPAAEMAARFVSPVGSSLIGRRVGVFEIQALLGVGGMGEVYRARDTRLGRTVAIKILPRAFTTDPDRLARFEREARVLASLNHSNIGTLYGMEEAEGQRALVLEFVEGQALSDRIAASALPVPEALAIAAQIADALDAAHEKGIVHRDLKPANIMITPAGAVKVLDFGLAKPGGLDAGAMDLSKSPTATREGTQDGVILGTAAYMSPEQARGKAVDKRTDIWAFGCVLYEMLTGRSAFGRETFSDTSAAILEHEADWSLLPKATPPVVTRLLRRCLEKDVRRRLRDIADARADVEEAKNGGVEGATNRTDASPRRAISRRLVAGMILALIVILAMGVWIRRSAGPAGEMPIPVTAHLTLPLPEGTVLANSYPSLSISRDGRSVALVAEREGVRSLYLRGLAESDWKPLPGTDGALGPFFSPDGEWLAFFTPGKLMRVSLAGGRPQLISEAPALSGYVSPTGDWGEDGRVVFSYWPAPGFFRVPAAGGAPERVEGAGTAGHAAVFYRAPRVLPGGQGLLFNVNGGGKARVQILPGQSREVRLLVDAGTDASVTRSGHLVYGWENQILAVPFTSPELRVRGASAPVLEGVRRLEGPGGSIDYSLSENGTLVYAPGSKKRKRLVWTDRAGKIDPVPLPPLDYRFPALSPSGGRVAVTVADGPAHNVWVGDLRQGTLTPLTLDGDSVFSLWSPDGKDVVFSSGRLGTYNIFRRRVDAAGDVERLTNSPNPQRATGFSTDGRWLVFNDQDPRTVQNLWVLPMNGGTPVLFLGSPAVERSGMFSPDGRWLAYDSNESGRYEVYVQAYPGPGQKKQISTEGGGNPMWNPNGREIFYTNGDRLMSASFLAGAELRIGKAHMLFQAAMITGEGPGRREYDVAADGARFLFVEDLTPGSTELHVVVNWFEELKRRVPIASSLPR